MYCEINLSLMVTIVLQWKFALTLKPITCTKGGLAGYRLDYWTMAWNANCVSQIDFNAWKELGLVLELQIV